MDEAQVETIETEILPAHQELDHWLKMAASYLSQALATRTEAATPKDRQQMDRLAKYSGAKLQLRMIRCYLNFQDLPLSEREIAWRLHHLFNQFWQVYEGLAVQHF